MKVHKKGAILSTMKIKSLSASLLVLLIFSGCALITDEYQQNQKKAIAFLDHKNLTAPKIIQPV